MRLILGAVLATGLTFQGQPTANAAAADAVPTGWEVARMLGTASALMPPAAEQVTKLVPDGEGGTRLLHAMQALEGGITYTVSVQSPLPAVMRGVPREMLQADLASFETELLGGPGRNVVVPAGFPSAAIEGWQDEPMPKFKFVRLFLGEDSIVDVSAGGNVNPQTQALVARFAASVRLDHFHLPASRPIGDLGSIDLTPLPVASLPKLPVAAAAPPVTPTRPAVPAGPPPRLPDPAGYAVGDVLLADAAHAFVRQPHGWGPAQDFGTGRLFTLVQPPPPGFFATGTIMLTRTQTYRLEQGQLFQLPVGQSAPLTTGFRLHKDGELVDLARLPNDFALMQEMLAE